MPPRTSGPLACVRLRARLSALASSAAAFSICCLAAELAWRQPLEVHRRSCSADLALRSAARCGSGDSGRGVSCSSDAQRPGLRTATSAQQLRDPPAASQRRRRHRPARTCGALLSERVPAMGECSPQQHASPAAGPPARRRAYVVLLRGATRALLSIASSTRATVWSRNCRAHAEERGRS